ncbi:helix-turn-helix domain-containing protein [Nocardia farcinica]|uniref:helix-turn-helix domain-containing protein n=1 Tax=Nocardia farcinica TaxID=37329 RepID=UPI00189429A2|nr:helix-turn-helix transcriptional regulator [Nocardia farcinica]MBF6264677.1 helix-turn-helix domain-containing protein [Nocardia farcinica]MBF6283462.1 helix-turn-helix domain-containing protein [Nocardia farcinica]MBF6307244.1 helix-turn-helix domain-containing protein [Nocardia farcinica]MBF6392202.1 helix-turn-helix domain-containing protein [Nocardia farcinica]MBF6492409.1 helix-turn-helix domain-containing protein [Nocardia farcinica]
MGKSVTRGSADDRERESSPTPGQVVPDGPVVTGVPHRQLGRILREMRSETGLSILTAAKAVGMGSGSLQRLECGQASKIHDAKLVKLCRLYQGMDRLEELKTLAAQRREQSWWDERTDMLAPSFKVYLGLEAAAERLTVYRPDIISSLFQTQEYAEVLDRIYFHDDSPGERAQRMEVRRKRLGLINRSLSPLEVDLVLDEGVLRRIVGGARLMSRQLRHLADMPPNVSLRVLPDCAGYPMGKAVDAFTLLDFGANSGKANEPPVVYVESFAGSMHLETPRSVRAYREAFRRIQRVALDRSESKRLLRRVAKEYGP